MITVTPLLCVTILLAADPADNSLKGTVADPAGKPIAGARVDIATAAPRFGPGLFCPSCYRDCSKSTRTDDRNSIPRSGRGQRGQPTTDEQGRFEIRQLPDQPVELMAFRFNPKGGSIRHASVVRPKLNQQDVRIVLDSALNEEIEDLDAPKPPTSKKP